MMKVWMHDDGVGACSPTSPDYGQGKVGLSHHQSLSPSLTCGSCHTIHMLGFAMYMHATITLIPQFKPYCLVCRHAFEYKKLVSHVQHSVAVGAVPLQSHILLYVALFTLVL